MRPRPRPRTDTARTPAPPAAGYPGDFRGRPPIEYAPVEGKLPDPGEIVWAWVPYEEDHTRGKERPVLLIGRDDPWLLAVPLTSKDHDRDRDQEASQGRFWIDVGTGAWDRSGRPSEARTNRVIRVEPGAVRRAGVRLDRRRFDAVAGEIRQHLT
ncbi:hypothetical protein GCM10028815_26150 [Mariniluteicoccus flavus]